MNPTQSTYSQLYSVTITKYYYMFRPFVDQHPGENMQEMYAYHLTYKHLYLLHINVFPTNCTMHSYDAPPCVGQEPRTSSGSYSVWEHMQLVMQLVSHEW